jgi:tetratricopeptide (TPR) repeat protein
MLEYRRALKMFPDNPTVQRLLKQAEQREQEAFRVFSEDRSHKLRERKETVTFEKYVEEDVGHKESSAEFLLRRLQEVKKAVPSIPDRPVPDESQTQNVSPSKIVTATLAEIYATQGEYKEAIEAYRKLASQRPIEAERYAKRIAQLEELSRPSQVEQPQS